MDFPACHYQTMIAMSIWNDFPFKKVVHCFLVCNKMSLVNACRQVLCLFRSGKTHLCFFPSQQRDLLAYFWKNSSMFHPLSLYTSFFDSIRKEGAEGNKEVFMKAWKNRHGEMSFQMYYVTFTDIK